MSNTLDHLYLLARAVRAEIDTFDPQIVVSLAHGANVAMWALEAVWQAACPERPLPVIAPVSLGREKTYLYEIYCDERLGDEDYMFQPDYQNDWLRGRYLAWIDAQLPWQRDLRLRINTALNLPPLHPYNLPEQPARILIVDDTDYEGGTYRLALGLIQAAYPNSQVHMLVGGLAEWRTSLSAAWLAAHDIGWTVDQKREVEQLIYGLAPGTEDVEMDTFDLRPIGLDSPRLGKLAVFLPAETWLDLPGWIQAQVQCGMRERLAREMGGETFSEMSDRIAWVRRLKLEPGERVMQAVWQRGAITRVQATHLSGLTRRQAGKLLRRLARQHYLEAHPHRRGRYYTLGLRGDRS
jgi:hypothetical protein